MNTYVLIHGAWHGAWCWYKTIPLLEGKGHKVISPDLPGHGVDKTPGNRVSLKSYTNLVCGILDNQEEPVILVGHSMGGVVLSQAAEHRPAGIKTLVYVAAYLLADGETVLDETRADEDSRILPNLVFPDDPAYVLFRPEALRETFYRDCSDEDVSLARILITPQPQSPLMAPVNTTMENYGRVPRIYIETRQDRAITPQAQERMYTAQPCKEILSMDTGHSPFFSAPEVLAKHLLSV